MRVLLYAALLAVAHADWWPTAFNLWASQPSPPSLREQFDQLQKRTTMLEETLSLVIDTNPGAFEQLASYQREKQRGARGGLRGGEWRSQRQPRCSQ